MNPGATHGRKPLQQNIEDKFQNYIDKCMNSSAGEAFSEMFIASRYYFSLHDF